MVLIGSFAGFGQDDWKFACHVHLSRIGFRHWGLLDGYLS